MRQIHRIAIVVSRFNEFITENLLLGAKQCLESKGYNNIEEFWVPGAFELPLASKKLAETKKFDAIVTLGAVIRGGTPHFDYVCNECARGLLDVSLKYGIPVSFGVLTTDNIEQAKERSKPKGNNKGVDAALTVIEMLEFFEKVSFLN